jgi:hypothetical protein
MSDVNHEIKSISAVVVSHLVAQQMIRIWPLFFYRTLHWAAKLKSLIKKRRYTRRHRKLIPFLDTQSRRPLNRKCLEMNMEGNYFSGIAHDFTVWFRIWAIFWMG